MSPMQNLTPDLATELGRLRHLRSVLLDVQALECPYDHTTCLGSSDDPYDCGTPVCALGWYVRDGAARKAGWSVHRKTIIYTDKACDSSFAEWGCQVYFGAGVYERIFAATAFQDRGIAPRDVQVHHVLERLDRIIAEREAEPV